MIDYALESRVRNKFVLLPNTLHTRARTHAHTQIFQRIKYFTAVKMFIHSHIYAIYKDPNKE